MSVLNLTYFDYIILLITSYSMIAAFFKGVIKAGTSFLGWIFSIFGCRLLYNPIYELLNKVIPNEIAAMALAALSGYVVSLLAISILNSKIIDLTVDLRGGIIDRSLGFAFGFLRGVIISCALFQAVVVSSSFFLNQSGSDGDKDVNLPVGVKEAKTFQLLNQGSGFIVSAIPKEWIQEQIDMLNSKINTRKDQDGSPTGANPVEGNTGNSKPQDKLNTDDLLKEFNNLKDVLGTGDKSQDSTDSNDITNVIKKLNDLGKDTGK